jgi:YD repeat-containing protein
MITPFEILTDEDQELTYSSTYSEDLASLSSKGVLWAINRQVFHPRGFALALTYDGEDNIVGWEILGNGQEPWNYEDGKETDKHREFEKLLAKAARDNGTTT